MMESRKSDIMSLDSILGDLSADKSSVIKSEVEVLRGRTLMGHVVDELGLMHDLEFNGYLRPKGLISRLKGYLSSEEEDTSEPDPGRVRDSVISSLLRKVTITNVPQSLVFRIGVETESAVKSADIADSIARQYLEDQVRLKFEATERAATWLSEQASDLKIELQDHEDQIRSFRNQTSLTSSEAIEAMDRQLKETRERRAALELELGELERKAGQLQDMSPSSYLNGTFADARLSSLAASAASDDENAIVTFYGRLDDLKSQVDQDIKRIRGQASSLSIAESGLMKDIDQQSQDLAKIEQMRREAEATKLLYEHFQTRLKEAVAQQGIQQADSRILSNAVVPGLPSSPRVKLGMFFAGLLGIIIGSVFVLLKERLTSGVRTIGELQALTGQIVLGQIPLLPDRQRSKVLGYLAKNPTSAAAEAIRNLRTSILLSNVDGKVRTISVTSSVPGEGKTTISLSLCQHFTSMGKKVLIIEGDIRRRSFRGHLSIESAHGLVSVLSGKADLASAVKHVDGLGDVLVGQNASVNAADLFSSTAFDKLLDDAKRLYDLVIIDTPPVLVVSDARIIAPKVDSTLFVVRWNHTSAEQIQEGLRMLDMPKTRIAGVVLSQVDPAGMRRYGYGNLYGAYSTYGNKYYLKT